MTPTRDTSTNVERTQGSPRRVIVRQAHPSCCLLERSVPTLNLENDPHCGFYNMTQLERLLEAHVLSTRV